MAKKRNILPIPAIDNSHLYVYYELEFGKSIIKPGDKLKIKNERGNFIFVKWVHNTKTDTSWIDCLDNNQTKHFRSFRIDRIKSLIKPKKSRAKKIDV